MNFKTLTAAAAIAISPMIANAATFVEDGGTYEIGPGDEFFGDVEKAKAIDFWSVKFESNTDPLQSNASATIGNVTFKQFEDLTLWWISASDWDGTEANLGNGAANALASIAITPLLTELNTTFESPDDLDQYLVVTWSKATKKAAFDIEITTTPIPVPAGILLMGTALAGLGVMRRRKKAA